MRLSRTLVPAAVLLVAGSAIAATPTTNSEHMPFNEMMQMKMADKNKDGKVSKKEFMDMMSKTWDMNAAKMGAKGSMTDAQMRELMMYIKAP